MVPIAALIAFAAPAFSKPIPWALNFAPSGSIPMVGDIDGDGYADLIRVSLPGDSFIDVAVNSQGYKSVIPKRANSNWGKNCQAAVAGEFDQTSGADVVGLFDGDILRLAHAFKNGVFQDEPEWVKLPGKLRMPHLASADGVIYAWEEGSGIGFKVIPSSKAVTLVHLQSHIAKLDAVIAANGHATLFTFADGRVALGDNAEAKSCDPIGRCEKGSFPALAGAWIFVDEPIPHAPTFVLKKLATNLPKATEVWCEGDMEHKGRMDLVDFRFGGEPHTGNNVLLFRRQTAAVNGSTPIVDEYSGDGIPVEWKLNGYRGLDLKALGCAPGQKDIVVLISRYSTISKNIVDTAFKRIVAYYHSLGWELHPIFLDEVKPEDQSKPWWQLRDMFLPSKWRGVAHWMAISPNGGGQADELSDGGICGGNDWTMYATFIHEFGHQLGLPHNGFWNADGCPIYSSLMNYPYSYTYENDIKKIHYSDGRLANFVLNETDLDETLPLPYEKVKFLEDAPYHYHLKANGATTLIDWNWNGIFGEKHVRADINYAYSTSAGRRDEAGKTQTAPWTFTHGRDAYALYGLQSVKADGKSDPSVLPEKPGWLELRRLAKPFRWARPMKIVESGVTGDPVAISYKGEIAVAYPSTKGLSVDWLKVDGDKVTANDHLLVDDTNSIPFLGIYKGRLFLIEWAPTEGYVRYRTLTDGHKFSDWAVLLTTGDYPAVVKSDAPVSMTVDTIKDEVVLGTSEDQDPSKANRWAIRRYKVVDDKLRPSTPTPHVMNSEREWIQGAKYAPVGRARSVLLFDEKGVTGMRGRLLYYTIGMTSEKSPWSCAYVVQSIGDKTVNGGWMIKRYYDEWTQSRSAPGACWFGGDILYAYRWADGSQGDRDNILHVGYNGSGIESTPMGDFDDISFIRDFGMQNSILYLRE